MPKPVLKLGSQWLPTLRVRTADLFLTRSVSEGELRYVGLGRIKRASNAGRNTRSPKSAAAIVRAPIEAKIR